MLPLCFIPPSCALRFCVTALRRIQHLFSRHPLCLHPPLRRAAQLDQAHVCIPRIHSTSAFASADAPRSPTYIQQLCASYVMTCTRRRALLPVRDSQYCTNNTKASSQRARVACLDPCCAHVVAAQVRASGLAPRAQTVAATTHTTP